MVGLVFAAAARGPGGRVFAGFLLAALASLAIVIWLYSAEPARVWSLPTLPLF